MYALVDANSFYASAEKVFDPAIRQRPVVVLTNNDGCICALCEHAKQLGVKKFGPYYKVKKLLAQHNAGCGPPAGYHQVALDSYTATTGSTH